MGLMTVDGLQGFAFQTEAFSADLLARASSAFAELVMEGWRKGCFSSSRSRGRFSEAVSASRQ